MPHQEHVISIFVASPNDVLEERKCLEDVVRELNMEWSRKLGIRFDLLRWETHVHPGIAEEPQEVINEQIPSDFDIFLGIMWHRFGTSTKKADSGTIEEYQRALDRNRKCSNSVQIMIYFKESSISPYQIDSTQFEKVKKFRASLSKDGVLYESFQDVENFSRLVRLHLTKLLQGWESKLRHRKNENQRIERLQPFPNAKQENEVELGILDLMDLFEDQCETLVTITERFAKATENIGENTKRRTAELTAAHTIPTEISRRQRVRAIITRSALNMDQYAEQIEADLPVYGRSLEAAINALIRAVKLSLEFRPKISERESMNTTFEAITKLRTSIESATRTCSVFRQVIDELPSMTVEFNRSKRRVSSSLTRWMEEQNTALPILREAEQTFNEFHNSSND